MEENQEKVVFYIVFFLIVVVFLSIFIKGYDAKIKKENNDYSQGIVSNKKIENNSNNEVKTNNEDLYSNEANKARFFYSSDNKYYLVLTNNFRAYSNPDMGTNDKRFLMNIDNFYSTDSFTGRYEIKDNTIKLIIEAGCLDEDNKFSCVVPDKIKINKNIMTLEYKTNEIKFGTINLIEQK